MDKRIEQIKKWYEEGKLTREEAEQRITEVIRSWKKNTK
jgi:polyhydroxyalkanoate synthesis regulator phasin